MTDPIVAFIRERLTEREAAMRPLTEWPLRGRLFIGYTDEDGTGSHGDFDVEQELRGVEAKRAIMDEHALLINETLRECRKCSDLSAHQYPESATLDDHPCRTLRLLACEWNTHPAYQTEWRP